MIFEINMYLFSLLECFYGIYREYFVCVFFDWDEFYGQVLGELCSYFGCFVLVYISFEYLFILC